MPVVQLFKRATTLAEAALCTRRLEDLELAFGGDARSAFLWLQCFLADEDDWCCTRGCPGMHVYTETSSVHIHNCIQNLTYIYSLHHYSNLEHGIPYPTYHRRLAPLHFPLLFAHLFARALSVWPLPPSTPAHPPRTPRSAFLGPILGPRLLAVPPLARKPPLRRHPSPDQRMRQPRSPRRLPSARRLVSAQAQPAPPRRRDRRARFRRRRTGHQAAQVPPRKAAAEDEGRGDGAAEAARVAVLGRGCHAGRCAEGRLGPRRQESPEFDLSLNRNWTVVALRQCVGHSVSWSLGGLGPPGGGVGWPTAHLGFRIRVHTGSFRA
jgi:hypothetical protein